MGLTQQQIWKASKIDARVQKLRRAGKSDIEILIAMENQMPPFRALMETTMDGDFSVLTTKFPGLFHYARFSKASQQ